jgi:hypothetical protein
MEIRAFGSLEARGLRKVDIVTPDVETVSGTGGRWQHLQRSGTTQVGILGGADGEEIVASNIHDDESISDQETAPICPRFKSMTFNVDRCFGDEIGLIFFLHRT